MADRDIPEEMVEKAARELREQYDSEHDAIAPSEMPPVPCPDCMHPTEHDGDLFHCTDCGQAFSTPNGMDLSMWWELWQAWTVRRQIVALPEPDGTSYEGDPMWGAHVDYEDIIFACVNDGRPEVDGPIGDEPLPADVAEMYGLRLLAAAREARRLAAGSGSGEGAQRPNTSDDDLFTDLDAW